MTIRPLDELDRRALLAFGRALPQADLLHLEHDLTSPEMIARLINARCAENWRLNLKSDSQVDAVRLRGGRWIAALLLAFVL